MEKPSRKVCSIYLLPTFFTTLFNTSLITSLLRARNLVEPSRRETQRVVKFLAMSGSSLALLGSDQAFAAVTQIPNGMMQTFVTSLGGLGDISSGFASAFLLIFFSELGDKTFFIAALLAARNNAATVFAGTFVALGYAFFLKQRLYGL